MAPFFANQSCDPFLPPTNKCIVGTYVSYSVNVTGADDVVKTIAFAKENRIRLVIRNTGHDYNGKSTGAGALAVWTHHLKDIEFFNYSSPHYSGKAIKMGAGVQGFEAYEAADARGLRVVGGECPTVGLAGGYSQGGGHSALASKYGLAADQVLEWEAVDAHGRLIVANRTHNQDLFWALSGGGGGAYAVAISMTSKAHAGGPVSGGNLTFTSDGISQDTYYAAISAWHASLPAIVDAGAMAIETFTNASFAITPITGPGISAQDLRQLMKPFTDTLDGSKINYTTVFRDFDSYWSQFQTMQSPIDVGIAQYGGRLIPRNTVRERNQDFTDAVRRINNEGGIFIGVGLNVSKSVAGDVDNAVLPAWRDAIMSAVLTTPWNFTAPWSEMLDNQRKMTNDFMPQLEALSPGGGAYVNEGDFRQPGFQQVFYGTNYDRLLEIKRKYDPNFMFYGVTAVGSEYWTEQADGRLCRV